MRQNPKFAAKFSPLTAQAHILIEHIRGGDERAFETLFREHYGMLCAFARKFVGDMDVAEEVVQGFFVGFWEKRAETQLKGSLRSYLFTSVRNSCLNHLKHQKVREQHKAYVEAAPMESGRPADGLMEAAELEERIAQIIRQLPQRCGQAFRLSRYEGKSYKEIAALMDISPKTVEVQIGKALKALREGLANYLPLFLVALVMEKFFL